ncbi:FAD-dependent oxidoreductase, partial [bacterium]|nr:FAD-dependent oxidoreductase [bacterium]
AENGAEVFLAAPRPYLGEDLCATYRLWLENGETPTTELAKRLFQPIHQQTPYNSLPFSYKTSRPSAAKHPDTKTPSKLMDGKCASASAESVQYDGDVTLIAEQKKDRVIDTLHVLAYQRRDDFVVDTVKVSTSADGETWKHVATIENPTSKRDNHESGCIDFKAKLNNDPRFIKMDITPAKGSDRILLGEIVLKDRSEEAPKKQEYANPTTPFQVKYELDQALLDAGADFLYSSMVTDALVDDNGKVCGFIMANRSGRQAVLAKVCIDASHRGDFARMAGVPFATYPSGKQTFKRIVVGGEPQKKGGLTMREMPTPVKSEANKARTRYNTFTAYEYTLELPMPDTSFASFANADQLARDLTWRPGQVDGSEILYQSPPDKLKEFDAQTYLTENPGVVVLGESLPQKTTPLQLMEMGRQVGKALATPKYLNQSIPKTVNVKSVKKDACEEGDIQEFLDGLRNIDTGQTIQSGERSIPVIGEYDVVVIGGGTGGAPAGIGAARDGAKTLVVEYLHGLGGVGTQGLIGHYYFGYQKGFTSELDAGVAKMKDLRESRRGWNVENKMEWYRKELRKAGADIWFGCMGSGAFVEDNTIKGAVVITPRGRGVVLCDVLIDSTGNADIAAAAGAETIFQGPEHAALQGTGLPPRMLNENYTNTDYTFIYDDDMLDLWRAFVIAKEKFKGAYDLAQIIDSRERRRIVGDHTISPLDILNNRRHPDTISLARSNFDTHGYTTHPYFALDHPDKTEKIADTPYRALLPKGMDGIIVTGLGISAHRDAMPILRMQVYSKPRVCHGPGGLDGGGKERAYPRN